MEDTVNSKEGSPILGQNLARPLEAEEGPGYGKRLTGLDFKELPRWAQVTLKMVTPAVIGLIVFRAGEAAKIDLASASELGPTPKVLPAPEKTIREAEEFEAIIEAINQEPHIAAITTPTATEIQQQHGVEREEIITRLETVPDGSTYLVNTDRWVFEVRDGVYVSESRHYVEPLFLPAYQKLGRVIGLPLGESLPGGSGGARSQYFERGILGYFSEGYREEVRVVSTQMGSDLYLYPLGAKFFLDPDRELSPQELGERIDQISGLSLDLRIQAFVRENGIEELIGKVISSSKEEGTKIVQFTTNFGFEIDKENGEVRILNLGEFFAQPILNAQEFIPRFPSAFTFLESIDSHLADELTNRAVYVLNYHNNGNHSVLEDMSDIRDYTIIKDMMGGEISENQVLNQTEVGELLAQYMVRYELHPNMQRLLNQLYIGWQAIDRVNHRILSPNLYESGELPSVPDLHNRFVFNKNLGNWGHYSGYPEVFDNYGMLEGLTEEDYVIALNYLSGDGLHELIHSLTQVGLRHPGPPIRAGLDLSIKEDRMAHSAHVHMGVVTAVGRKALELNPQIDSRSVSIYARLTEAGGNDTYDLIYRTGAIGDARELWEIYEQLRIGGRHSWLSMDELFGSEEAGDQVSYSQEEWRAIVSRL